MLTVAQEVLDNEVYPKHSGLKRAGDFLRRAAVVLMRKSALCVFMCVFLCVCSCMLSIDDRNTHFISKVRTSQLQWFIPGLMWVIRLSPELGLN